MNHAGCWKSDLRAEPTMCASLPPSRAFGRISQTRLPTNGGLVFTPNDTTHPDREGSREDDFSLSGVRAEGSGVTNGDCSVKSQTNSLVFVLFFSLIYFR